MCRARAHVTVALCADVGNLRGAKATDTYICKGDPEGEDWQPVFTQHGFRCVARWTHSKGVRVWCGCHECAGMAWVS